VLFSQKKPATSNQPAVLFSQNKPAPAISHQPTEQAEVADLYCALVSPAHELYHLLLCKLEEQLWM
jgi:hypothetical protein